MSSTTNKTKTPAGKDDNKDDDERASKKPKTTETTTAVDKDDDKKTKDKEDVVDDDKPDWIKDKKVMSGSYMIVYKEGSVDNQAVLYDDPTTESTDMIDRCGKIKLTFSSSSGGGEEENENADATTAAIVSMMTTDPQLWPPVGELTNGQLVKEENHWLWDYEWRPCQEFLNDSNNRRFFENYAYSKEEYEYDDKKPETNFIEFTINGKIKSSSAECGCGRQYHHYWEFLDRTGLEQLPDTCLLAHFHTLTRGALENGDPFDQRLFDSFILCREDDFDNVRDTLLASIKRHELYSKDD